MLIELVVVEQRYRAVLEVLNDGASVSDVARRYGVVRQTVHTWLRKYASAGLGGLADGSSRPVGCPHQMSPETEAVIVEWRGAHPTGTAHHREDGGSPSLDNTRQRGRMG